jgi:protein kinase-like protein/PDZ domain-containing protein
LGRVGVWSRVGFAVAVLSFGGHFALTTLGDLFPLEQFGADLATVGQFSAIQRIEPDSPAARAGFHVGDRVVAVEGRPVSNPLDWGSAFARVDTGKPMVFTVQRGADLLQLPTTFHQRSESIWTSHRIVFLLLARGMQLVTLIVAVVIGLRAKERSDALGSWLLATISAYTVGLPPRMAVVWRHLPVLIQPLFYLPSLSKVLIGFTLFTFFSALLKVTLGPWRRAVIALPFLAFAVWDAMFLVSLLYRPQMIPMLSGFLPGIIVVNFGYVIAALAMLVTHYRTLSAPSERRRLCWIVVGSVFGCAAGAPTVAGLWLGIGNDPTLIYHTPFSLQLVYTAFLVMPASFWWAIARGELFDFGFVVRRGLHYVFARRGLLVITPVVSGAFVVDAAAFHQNEPLRQVLVSHSWIYYGTFAALFVFRRRRSRWLEVLDRRLFRERYDAVQLLREVAAQVRGTRDVRMAAEYAVTQIDAALHPEWLAVFAGSSTDDALSVLAGHPPIAMWPQKSAAVIERYAARLVAPAASDLAGVKTLFVLGAKRSGEPYSKEDRNLVHAIAESIGYLVSSLKRVDDANESKMGDAVGWDKRLWTLADAVASGSHVDWTRESTEVVADERRQMLLELQALERLMQVHGTAPDAGVANASTLARWGDFELRERIGAGRFGTVYRAWDPKLEREVAIKLLAVAGVDRAAYLREARHLARVRHPNVVHVYGADEREDVPGLWMELIQGRTLAEDVRESGPFAVEELAPVANVLCCALSAVHRAGLVHQDVKAQNVMREPDGRLVLMDLGSVIAGTHRPSWGTPRYMAPELFNGGVATPRSDIYSLGVLLFVLATGVFPIEGHTYEEVAQRHERGHAQRLRDRRADLPPAWLDAFDCAMHSDPGRRFSSADEMSAAMRAAEVT